MERSDRMWSTGEGNGKPLQYSMVHNPTLKVRKDGSEELPLIQGKEQQLHFAGRARKRYTKPKVRETQVRW